MLFNSRAAFFPVLIVLSFVVVTILHPSLISADTPTNEAILVQDNSAFAIALYQELRESDSNLFFSPYSISTALAMTYAGARGNTAKQMARTLRFSLGQETLHSAFADIQARLNTLQKSGNVKLDIANSLWPQQDYEFLEEYLSLVEKHYSVSITPVDYEGASEAARVSINDWVEKNTQGKIRDIIPPDVLTELTRLVLVNAIYFKGNWESQFKTSETKDRTFYLSANDSVQAATMTQEQAFWYADHETLQVIELPYAGNALSMFLLLPHEVDGLAKLESNLTLENLKQWKHRLRPQKVRIFLPKFTMTSTFDLGDTLVSMGMADAFDDHRANFAGMDGRTDWLYIASVLHKAYVEVNEKGTEAAAATGVIGKARSISLDSPVFRADHPFLFLIQENATGSILFLGRLNDPTGA